MDASLGDKDGTTGSKDLPSTQIDQQQKELMDHFTKLHEAYTKKDYDAWLVLWPLFEKEYRTFLETHVTTSKLPPNFEFFEGLPLNTDNTESGFNLEHLPLPAGDEWFTPDMDRILDEFSAGTMENDQIPSLPANELPLLLPSPPANKPASPPPLADQPLLPPPPAKKQALPAPPLDQALLPLPPAKKQALPPPPPLANSSSSPPPLADQASTNLTQAVTHAKDASILITKAAVNGSIGLNKDSVCHLESCETHISAAKASLRAALFHLSQARVVNQGESLSQLMKDD